MSVATKSAPAMQHAQTSHEAPEPTAAVAGGHATGETSPPVADGYRELRVWAEMFEDAQKARIAARNRAERGGVDPVVYAAHIDALERSEHSCGLALRRCYRRVVSPEIVAWQRSATGIGEHLLARLLGTIGHPVRTEKHHWDCVKGERILVSDGPFSRRMSDLWSYCGHGDSSRKRERGMSAEDAAALGNPRAKVLVHLLAESCVKFKGGDLADAAPNGNGQAKDRSTTSDDPPSRAASPYRPVYDEARARYASKEEWTPGHQHAAALRLVGKEILRDLWLVAGGS